MQLVYILSLQSKYMLLINGQPQVLSANVNLASEIALVSLSPLLSQEKTATDWQKQLGEKLAHHLTTCGFTSTLRGNISKCVLFL